MMMIITTIFLVSPVSLSQVIALICNLFVNLLMILCLLSTNWLTTTKYRQGLWQYCIDVDSPRPLPFGITDEDGCHWGREVGEFCWSFSFFWFTCTVADVFIVCFHFSLQRTSNCRASSPSPVLCSPSWPPSSRPLVCRVEIPIASTPFTALHCTSTWHLVSFFCFHFSCR